jgi:CheY-like chemotaxis protein
MNSKILIIDGHKEFRSTLGHFLKKELHFIEVIEAKNGEKGLSATIKHQPNIILIDLQLSHMDGIATSEKIKNVLPESFIVLLALFAGDIRKRNNVSKAIDEVVGKNEIEKKLLPLLKKYIHDRKWDEAKRKLNDIYET